MSDLVVATLQALDYPELSVIEPRMFATGKATTKIAESVLWFLFIKLDKQKCSDTFAGCWPIIDRVNAREFRNAAFKWLEQLKKEHKFPADVAIRRSFLDECRGERFERIILALQQLVLNSLVQQESIDLETDALLLEKDSSEKLALIDQISSSKLAFNELISRESRKLQEFNAQLQNELDLFQSTSSRASSATSVELERLAQEYSRLIKSVELKTKTNDLVERIFLENFDRNSLDRFPIELPAEYSSEIKEFLSSKGSLFNGVNLNLEIFLRLVEWNADKLDSKITRVNPITSQEGIDALHHQLSSTVDEIENEIIHLQQTLNSLQLRTSSITQAHQIQKNRRKSQFTDLFESLKKELSQKPVKKVAFGDVTFADDINAVNLNSAFVNLTPEKTSDPIYSESPLPSKSWILGDLTIENMSAIQSIQNGESIQLDEYSRRDLLKEFESIQLDDQPFYSIDMGRSTIIDSTTNNPAYSIDMGQSMQLDDYRSDLIDESMEDPSREEMIDEKTVYLDAHE